MQISFTFYRYLPPFSKKMALAIQTPNYLRKQCYLHSSPPSRSAINRATILQIRAEAEDKSAPPRTEEASLSTSSTTKSKGFGLTSSSPSYSTSGRRDKEKGGKKKRDRERASIIRRSPVEKPALLFPKGGPETEQKNSTEGAFLLTWLALGILIFVEGILLAGSGFLPEEWDKFLVKYLYPSFTPTVFLFVSGTVTYGVLKYLQGEKQNKD